MMPMPNIFCLVCDISINISSSINIFSTSFPCHKELLVNFVSRVLRTTTSNLQNPYICSQCYNLFQMLEQAQKTVLNIRCEILKIYCATERRKGIKQSINNDAKLSLGINIPFDEQKLNCNNENLRGKLNSQTQSITKSTQVEKLIQQQCVQDNVASQNINILNGDYVTNSKIATELKKHFKKKLVDHNEEDNVKSFDYNNSHNDIKKDDIFNSDKPHNSVELISENNIYNISTPQGKYIHLNNFILIISYCTIISWYFCVVNTYALKVHVGEQNFVSLIDSKRCEPKNSVKTDSIFSKNRLQVQSIDLEWKEENETTENTTVPNDKIKIPSKSGKTVKYNIKSLKYSCSICDKRWRTSTELKTHMKTHSTLRPYMCEKCGQAYKQKRALEIHVGMHNGINPFQCNFCSKCFTQKGALRRHLPMHTGEMPYQCELCGKRFIHHTSYKMHRLSHSGKKSYKCHMCDLSLLSTSHLKRHMRVHTGEKPYSCTVCGKRFAERYNLLAHQKIHDPLENKVKKTKGAQYQCNHCNLIFEQKKNLNDHMKHHCNVNETDFKKSQCTIVKSEMEIHKLSKKIESEHVVLQETWIQMNRPKLDIIDNQTRFVLLQNTIPKTDENSFAVTFSDEKVSLGSTNYNTNLQVIIEPTNASLLNSNIPSIDKMHI